MPQVVRESFVNVGLSPWREKKKLEALEKNSRDAGQVDQDKAYYVLCKFVKICSEKKVEECCQLIRGLKPVRALSESELEEGKDPEDVGAPEDADEDLPCSTSGDNNFNCI